MERPVLGAREQRSAAQPPSAAAPRTPRRRSRRGRARAPSARSAARSSRIEERARRVVRVDQRAPRGCARASDAAKRRRGRSRQRGAALPAAAVGRARPRALEAGQVLEQPIARARQVHAVARVGEQSEQVRVALAGAGREDHVLGDRARRPASRDRPRSRLARAALAARVGLVAAGEASRASVCERARQRLARPAEPDLRRVRLGRGRGSAGRASCAPLTRAASGLASRSQAGAAREHAPQAYRRHEGDVPFPSLVGIS